MFIQSLDGPWELRRVGTRELFAAEAPGCIHTDLVRVGRIEDPFRADNEYRGSWVHETDWTYSREFHLDARLLDSEKVVLECDGLDTIASVKLNGEEIGRTDNMYVQHRFDVTGMLRPDVNRIDIEFISPVNHAKPLIDKGTVILPGDSIPGSPYVRKSPCQWGWDWGPKIPTSGIWRSIRLASYDVARIADLWIRQKHNDAKVTLDLHVALEQFDDSPCSVKIRLTHPDGGVEEHGPSFVPLASITIGNPKLWWPNGYGDQPLYTVEAELVRDGEVLQTVSRRIGLRTLELEQKDDEFGRSFTFVVNGVKIFAKGANWIPADQFPSRITDERYRHLISSAAKANMNMLRIWGGGFYEDERFYDLCDEYGILIWQDFMFSCAHYPVDEAFLANVSREVEYNVKRLRSRACLALWCGNNEMEICVAEWWKDDFVEARKPQYLKIFHELIPPIVSELDPDRAYWPSSPSSGPEKPFEKPGGPASGDTHYWGVWFDMLGFETYRQQNHRFVSEFGAQSVPALETVKSFAGEDDLNLTSYIMECHQKHRDGTRVMVHYLARTFRFPKDFEMTCYVTQILQAEAIRCGVEHWRRIRGRCMGTLYWQLDDCWPVLSWSSIDYFGRWKALHYAAKRFFAPVMLSVAEEGTQAPIHVTNDTLQTVPVEVAWSLERFDGTVLRNGGIQTEIEPESDKLIADLDFSGELKGDTIRQAVLVHELLIDGKRSSLGMTAFVPNKHLDLPRAETSVKPVFHGDEAFLEVTSDKPARFVWLSIPGRDVIFSDNSFDLPAGRTVTVRVESEIEREALSQVRSYSLRDSY